METWKDLFDIPENVTYLNCAYMGPLMKSALKEGEKAAQMKAQPWSIPQSDFFDPVEKARLLFAQLVHTDKEQIALIPSASYGLATAMKNLSHLPTGEILLLEDQFPSNVYVWKKLAEDVGHKVCFVKKHLGHNLTDQILSAIHKETRVVALPHVHWCDGVKINLKEISRKVHQVGAKLVIDGTQSVGAVPLDVQEIRPHFLVVAAYKWLLGPYTTGFLYVDQEFLNGEPLEYNWLSRQGSENFQNLVNYQDRFANGARRFDMGEKSQFQSLPILVKSLEELLRVGVKPISQHCQKLNEYLINEISGLKIDFWDPLQRSENILGLYFANVGAFEKAKQQLQKQNIFVSYRGRSMRVSPHIYNSVEHMERLAHALKGCHS